VRIMMQFEIRSASSSEAGKLLPLMEQLGYSQTLEAMTSQINLFLKQDGYGIAVAEETSTSKIVGWIAWSKSILIVSPAIRLHIEGLVVEENYRGNGIGKALMLHVENIAKLNSPCIVDLTSGKRRAKDGSHEFYASLGYHNEGYMAKKYLRKIF